MSKQKNSKSKKKQKVQISSKEEKKRQEAFNEFWDDPCWKDPRYIR